MKSKNDEFIDASKIRTYSAIFITIVLACVILINMIFSSLNLKLDLTPNKLFTISDVTIDLLKGLDKKIKITVLSDESTAPLDYKEIVEKYKNYSDNIEVVYKDPQKSPRYFDVYTGDKSFSQYSIIVENTQSDPLKYRLINSYTLMPVEGNVTLSYVEKCITDAISYVTSDKTRNIYLTEGHQEMTLHSDIIEEVKQRNYEVDTINLNTEDISIETTDMILMFSPQTDISEAEVEKIKDYLSKGGRMLFAIDYVRDDLVNLKKVINTYGLDFNKSIILEGDTSRAIQNYPEVFIPIVQSHEITEGVKDGPMYLSSCMPIVELETKKSTLELTPILKTSALAYAKTSNAQALTKEEGDEEGPFTVAQLVIDKAENTGADKDTQVMVVSTSSFVNPEFLNQTASMLDLDFLYGTIIFMTDNPYNLNILPKDNVSEILNVMLTVNNQIVIGICIIVLPLAFFVVGGIVWYRRKSL